MAVTNDFFTLQSLGTFAGASAATVCGANTIQYILGFNPRWLALAVAEFVCLGVVVAGQIDGNAGMMVTPYFVALLNGVLVFCSAAGVTAVGAEAQKRTQGAGGGKEGLVFRTLESAGGPERRGFWQPWF